VRCGITSRKDRRRSLRRSTTRIRRNTRDRKKLMRRYMEQLLQEEGEDPKEVIDLL
jgi:hypothetical protein